jgi:hypothetical protein
MWKDYFTIWWINRFQWDTQDDATDAEDRQETKKIYSSQSHAQTKILKMFDGEQKIQKSGFRGQVNDLVE